LIFGTTPGTPTATETDEGAGQAMPLLLRQLLPPCGGRRILLD
jgi:hypothetical protein